MVAGFQGDIERWYFITGDDAWTTPDVIDCEEDCDPIASNEDNCISLFSECAYEGIETEICGDTPFTDIDYEVLSIKLNVNNPVPIYLHNLPCYNGQEAEITQDVECIESGDGVIDFQSLLAKGITLMDTETAMNKSGKHARYSKPTLTKVKKSLKDFKQ